MRARTRETPAESGATLKPESPASRSAASTRRSVFGFANENSRLIATASAPLALTASTSRGQALHLSARAESRPRRSLAPQRQIAALSRPGTPAPAQTSRRAALAPAFRSQSCLQIRLSSQTQRERRSAPALCWCLRSFRGAPPHSPRRPAGCTPSSTAREGSAGVEKIFFTRSFPSARQTQSVNVPPVSIAMRKSAHSS